MLPKLELSENEVHLYLVFPKEIEEPTLLNHYHSLLNPEEATQQARFHFPRHRHQYLVTRATIRGLLSRYVDVRPNAWVFEKNKYGRPKIADQHQVPPLHFNLSHTEGLVACAITLNREIGVDVENIKRGGDLIGVADRFFSPAEVKDLHTVPEADQLKRFFDYWTLKESYIKARGMGLSIPLEQFSFHIKEQEHQISISIDERQNDNPDRWQFRQWRIDERYKIALCVEKVPNVQLRIKKLVPFASEEDYDLEVLRKGW